LRRVVIATRQLLSICHDRPLGANLRRECDALAAD
jgi:hypothetical protein